MVWKYVFAFSKPAQKRIWLAGCGLKALSLPQSNSRKLFNDAKLVG